ncbi:MAG TPA: hypothetical protein VIM12_00465 [Noviherbaspirillum sp.]|uniref:hypothetical protein n=1 Tax=Noviherbaspirillum sp. TaxID=1926288 RepID=UPI002F95A9BD
MMSQTPEEQANLATWSQISEDVRALGLDPVEGMEIASVTGSIAQKRGYPLEVVMDALLEGVQQGVLSIERNRVRYRS